VARDEEAAGERTCGVVVVGGGLAGLTAAWRLRDHDVVVLEADERVGGRIHSERRGEYWLNFGAHVFGSPASTTGRLLDEIGVEAASVPGRLAAVAMNGALVTSEVVETFPLRIPLPLESRLALLRAGSKLRLAVRRYRGVAEPRPGEPPAERQRRMLEFLDDRSFAEFVGPLPGDAAALFRSTLTRSSGEPHELAAGYGVGYFHLVWNRGQGLSRNVLGGSGALVGALARALAGRIETSARVTSVCRESDGVSVAYSREGREHRLSARAAVIATPAYVTQAIVDDLPAETRAALAAISYGPYVVGAFLTGERAPMPWDDIYALATPKRSFGMLFNTANVLREPGAERRPGGTLMVYAAADLARSLDGLDDGAVAERFTRDLCALFPAATGILEEVVVRRWERGLPYPRPGRSRLQAALTRPLAPIHLAGDYLGTWYTDTAIQTALDAAAAVTTRRM